MNRRGFSFIEVLFALAILIYAGTSLISILTHNSVRIAEGHRFDQMMGLAEKLLIDAVDEGWKADEEELEWEPFSDANGNIIHEDYQWRYVRRQHNPTDAPEGSDADDLLRDKIGYTGPFMEYRVEIRLNSEGSGVRPLVLWQLVPPPHPGNQLKKVETGTNGSNP